MGWIKPRFAKVEINRAGDTLSHDKEVSLDSKSTAIEVLDNWRASHSYPMHVFKVRLKREARIIDKNSLTVQRLKRVPAIIAKLRRSYDGRPATMQLVQMQDLGGCRAVVKDVASVRKLAERYYVSDLKHKKSGGKDYIENPKPDGYRGIHIVYKYVSDKKGKKVYNGLLIEIQIRSRFQHLWATAVETVDFFSRQAIKSNEGSKEWKDFFRLVSSAFAMMEGCPAVPGTPIDERKLYMDIKEIETRLSVMVKMRGWAKAIRVFKATTKESKKFQFFLLELDIQKDSLNVSWYSKKQEQQAIERYAEIEKKNIGKKEFDVVLVGADNINELERGYPNYFVDSGEFLAHVQKIVSKYDAELPRSPTP